MNVGLPIEVDGGMDGGCQEKPTNLQERVSKGGKGTLVFHHSDHRRDLRAAENKSPNSSNQGQQKNSSQRQNYEADRSLKRAENQEAGGVNAAGN